MFEALDRRVMLSVSAHFADGQLVVEGSGAADHIEVVVAAQGVVTVSDGGGQIYSSETNDDSFISIRIDGGAGGDTIEVDLDDNDFSVSIYGGPGNDHITATAKGYTAAISGGSGNDIISSSMISGGVGNLPSVRGDDGNDRIRVSGGSGTGSGVAFGGDGDDDIRGFAAVDSAGGCNLNGGAGNDTIRGGNGRDILYGQAGNDLLWGSYKRDTLIGGAGDADRAHHDLIDVVVGCEESKVILT